MFYKSIVGGAKHVKQQHLDKTLERNLQMYDMSVGYNPPPDGNCFYASIQHQLQILDNSTESHVDLRQRLASFLTHLVSLTSEISYVN